ncbi:MAG: hypothetical protein ACRDMV_04690 [Streptosporangiales bacterium]
MATIADVRNEINKVLASAQVPGPFYAAAGVGDLAVEKVRAAQSRLQVLRPTSLLGVATSARGRAVGVYGDLTARGQKLVGRVDTQQATKDLEHDTGEVVRAAKATATTAKRGTANTKSAAKRTTTTARKTATTARKAAGEAARKTGDTKNASNPQQKSQGRGGQQRSS